MLIDVACLTREFLQRLACQGDSSYGIYILEHVLFVCSRSHDLRCSRREDRYSGDMDICLSLTKPRTAGNQLRLLAGRLLAICRSSAHLSLCKAQRCVHDNSGHVLLIFIWICQCQDGPRFGLTFNLTAYTSLARHRGPWVSANTFFLVLIQHPILTGS